MTRAFATKRKSTHRINLSRKNARAGTTGPGIPAASSMKRRKPQSRYGFRALTACHAAHANKNRC